MKVKCKGFEGNLKSINIIMETTELEENYPKYIYEIEISIAQDKNITIIGVKDEDIEFIKE